MMSSPLRIAVIGTRGFPNVQGGIEKHCEELYTRLAKRGLNVRVYARRGYANSLVDYGNKLEVVPLWTIRNKYIETLVHSFVAAIHAASDPKHFDIIHIHGIGPSVVVPLLKLLGFAVVVTNHGADYQRQKWGNLTRGILRLGEFLGTCHADAVIAVSQHIQQFLEQKYSRPVFYIPNGMTAPQPTHAGSFLRELGVSQSCYFLSVCRWVPEKGLHDLLTAFSRLDTDWKLVIAGRADHPDNYSISLRAQAKQDARVVLPGYVTGTHLTELYSNAGLYISPSYHEGLSLSILEAMSYNLPIACSDIPANVELIADEQFHFRAGDIEGLLQAMRAAVAGNTPRILDSTSVILSEFRWDDIAEKTDALYRKSID